MCFSSPEPSDEYQTIKNGFIISDLVHENPLGLKSLQTRLFSGGHLVELR